MIKLPSQPKIVKKEGNKAIFEIEALHPGYGATIGNSLRRVLLSSLPGAAITQVKIKGATHEFSTMPGVLEDVIVLMMNLKQMRFKLFTEESQTAFLKAKGEKEVKGSDFQLPSQMELVNKNCKIATLTSKSAELEMEVKVERGMGYSGRDARKAEKAEIGAIPLDAFFSPVALVSYRVENMRVGERTDFDRLFLEVETDGSISPEEAFLQAAEILQDHFALLGETFKAEIKAQGEKEISSEKKKKPVKGGKGAAKKTAKKK